MDKQVFIADYLMRNMRDHKLPYGMRYLNLLAETEEKAEKAYAIYLKKSNKIET